MARGEPILSCPECKGKTRVLETRGQYPHGIRRRRVCAQCDRRWTSIEVIMASNFTEVACNNQSMGEVDADGRSSGVGDNAAMRDPGGKS